MITLFNKYIYKNQLCTKKDSILITVSGGADSVVLLHLFNLAGYNTILAHCNFNLRGKESDEDEEFVKDLCCKYKIESHFISFNTTEYATKNKLSIEMAARELRYNWFSELCLQHSYTKIATGHHLNDSIETLFINLSRGVGINGITGISPKNGNVIRPLLSFTRQQIEDYTDSENLQYRNDSSNESLKHMRNIVRHEIMPAFKKINPSFEATMQQNMGHFSQAAAIFNTQMQKSVKEITSITGNQIKLSISKLLKHKQPQTLLFEIISAMGFSADSINKILIAAKGDSGRTFYSETHQLLVDRSFIIIEENSSKASSYIITHIDDFKNLPINILAIELNIENFSLIKDNNVACIDSDKIQFPLTLRLWKQADSFYPLGMKNKKKLSNFFIDQKIDRFAKEKTWLLECNGKIIWVVGLRIDDRFKVAESTKTVLKLTLKE